MRHSRLFDHEFDSARQLQAHTKGIPFQRMLCRISLPRPEARFYQSCLNSISTRAHLQWRMLLSRRCQQQKRSKASEDRLRDAVPHCGRFMARVSVNDFSQLQVEISARLSQLFDHESHSASSVLQSEHITATARLRWRILPYRCCQPDNFGS